MYPKGRCDVVHVHIKTQNLFSDRFFFNEEIMGKTESTHLGKK